MTTQTMELFQRTMLSEAAYANFLGLSFTDYNVKEALKASGRIPFSDEQADLLVANWRIVHHQPDTATGFSATLFQSKADSGVYVLAMRGTAGGNDLVEADILQIAIQGGALNQIVDLYNYWNYLRAGPSSSYQYETATLPSPLPGFPQLDPMWHTATKPSGDFVLPETVGSLDVIGHSLGGHLAFAFDRLFGGEGADVFSVNGAGFRASDRLNRFFDALAKQTGTSFDGSGTNVYGTAGPRFVTQDGPVLYQQGAHVGVYTESTKGTLGHGIAQHTDSTAVLDLFIRLDETLAYADPTVVFARLNPIFEAASAAPDFSRHWADWRRVTGTNTALPLRSSDRCEASRWAS